MTWRSLLLLLTSFAFLSCSATPHQPLLPATPLPTATPAPVRLPADDAPHDDLTEWWYYTGHLGTAGGASYGFEFVIFQVKRQAIPVLYAAHAAVTDHQRQSFTYDQRTWSLDRSPSSFDLGDGDWSLAGDGTADQMKAALNGYRLELRVQPTKPAALHGNHGVISFGPVGDSYYYSDTRLAVSGAIVDHGIVEPVTGEAWKDRQWGNFLVSPAGGWDWISAQLADGSDLMLFLLRDSTGQTSPAYGTWVDPTGKTETLEPSAAEVAAVATWRSPHTNTVYPSGWTVTIPGKNVRLRLEPVLPDQELDTRGSTGQIYWEGEVTIGGTKGNQPIGGKGYVELTGYAGRPK